ncbi:cytokine receptor family member b2 isoform X2 [Anguilla anguilla]|uniref:cytokine receptor family member b2 isoform X2 n=1 Tax=Anguilla anguilla TaxID=7936 RepID=UPI0015B0E9AE|nr:cytokine receptor family member b2 isoform X2 [Anguilla anguilla]
MFFKYLISLLYLTHRGTLTLLSPPVNVTVESVNLQSELSWSSVTNTDNVRYTVQYRVNRELFGSNKGSSDHDDWLEILNNITSRRCNLTFDVFINATLRVRAQDGNQISPWSQSRPFKAIDQSLFGPPNVTLWPRPEKGRLDVRIRDPFDRKDFLNGLKYRPYYKKATDSNWTIHSDTLSSASIENLEAGLNYCVQARYVWRDKLRPNSIPSTPKCAIISESGTLTLLSPPVNVTVESVNLQSELSWSSVTNTENVQYTVEFRDDHDDWHVLECSPTTSRRCNLTFDVFTNAMLRVRAQDGNQISPWSQSRPFKAIDQSLFGPPNVTLWPRPEKGRLDVRIRDPFDRKDFLNGLKYRLFYKKATDSNWTVHSDTLFSASIENLKAGLNYCVQARYVWRGKLRPNSIPSTPKCAIISESGTLTLLSPPVNVTVESVNLQSELSWSSVTNTENVWYRVEFRDDHDDWHVLECSPTTSRRCNLTFDVFTNAMLRVRAQDGNQISPWSQSRPFKAIDQSLFGPPNVTLWPRPEKGRLDVRIRDPFDRKDFSNGLKYRLYYKKPTDSNWTIHSDTLFSASIENLEAGLNYCVQARYVWRGKLRPNSIPSTPKCAIISESENSRTIRTVWVTALIILLTFGLSLMCIFMVNRNYDKFKQALQPPMRMPEHLYKFLSGEEQFLQPPVSSSSSSSSLEEEPLDKISLVTIEYQGGGGGEINLHT